MPHPLGAATPAVSAAATAASMALPPSRRTLFPTSAALNCPATSPGASDSAEKAMFGPTAPASTNRPVSFNICRRLHIRVMAVFITERQDQGRKGEAERKEG